jgi:tRNA pseudouridine55 synthase
VDGILVIDKQAGPTSHDIVASVRRLLKEKTVGHTGTLDPVATGVLPLVLGQASKVARYLTGGDKTYCATLRLGVTTTTLDAAGEVVLEKPVTVGLAEVESALKSFVGEISQVPPMYSAKKVDGKRLYELARKGVEIEREAKKVTIHAISIIEQALPDVTVEVRCSAGTYVRVLAQDLGEKLGCGGHLRQLRRVAAGPFTLDDAITEEALIADPTLAQRHLLPVSRGLSVMRRIDVPPHLGKMIASGYQLTVGDLKGLDTPAYANDQAIVLWLDSGELLAVVRTLFPSTELEQSRRDRRALKTERVLFDMRR